MKEITIKRITDTENDEYTFAERLLVNSFPTDEYREIEEQRKNVNNRKNFHMNIIYWLVIYYGYILVYFKYRES